MNIDFSTLWLKINYFAVSNRNQLKKWWVILMLAADVFIVVFVFTNLVLYLLGLARHQTVVAALINSPINYSQLRQQFSPSSLVITDNLVIPAGIDKFDLLTEVENLNKNWAVSRLEYKFDVAGNQSAMMTDFILPQSKKYLSALGVAAPSSQASGISFSFVNIEWQWVDQPAMLADYKFTVSDLEYSVSPLPSGQNVAQVTATIENTSLVGFWETRFIILLYNSSGKVAGVEYAYFDQFLPGKKMKLSAQWSDINTTISSAAVIPDFNLLAADNLIKR